MSALATASRRLRLRCPRLRVSRQRLRLAIAAALVSGLGLVGAWFLIRDSSFVAVEHVTVTGAAGAEAGAIRAALDSAARKMTTLDVQSRRLHAAVVRFPEVKGLRVSTQFPHGMVIHVIELLPVALVRAFGREVPVSGDGTLLPRVRATSPLPLIALPESPSGGRLRQPWALGAASLLAAAPRSLLARLTEALRVTGHGLVVQIHAGPSIYFGDSSRAWAKWVAAMAVLADPGSAGASYIDVTDPARPVAGTGAGVAATTAAGSTAPTSTTPAAPASTAPVPATSTTPTGG